MPNLMLTSHDLVRFGDLLQRGGMAEPTHHAYWERHKAAFSFLAAYSGPITLYYGDEIGQELPGFSSKVSNTTCALAGHCDDHVSRTSARIAGVATTITASPRVGSPEAAHATPATASENGRNTAAYRSARRVKCARSLSAVRTSRTIDA